jgi:hypothetical protein
MLATESKSKRSNHEKEKRCGKRKRSKRNEKRWSGKRKQKKRTSGNTQLMLSVKK